MKLKRLLILIFAIIIPTVSYAQLINTVVALSGNIFDAVTKEPVTAFIWALNEAGERKAATKSSSFENGYYYLSGLTPGKTYTIVIKQNDYFIEKYNLYIANTNKYEEISKDFLITPSTIGTKIKLPVPPFELNKSKIRFGGETLLESIKNTFLNNPKAHFEIHCFPDNAENTKDNLELTKKRCESLVEFFKNNGIDNSRITIKPHKEVDSDDPPPTKKMAKGKRYIGSTYLIITSN